MNVNIIDMLLILVVLLSILSGYSKGFILGTINLVTWAGSIIAGFLFYPYVATIFEKYIPSVGVWTLPLSFILTIIIARIIFSLLLTPVLKVTPVETHRSSFNKFLGVIPGLINGLINATILAVLLLALPLFDGLSEQTQNSKVVNKLTPPAEWLENKLSPVFDKAVNQTMNKLTVEPGSNETVNLPYTVTNTKIRADLEAQMLEMVNEERVKQGLKPVKPDPEMTEVARAHSKDMFARGYFSHYTPERKDPFDRMRAAKVRFSIAGENLALAQTLSIAHNGLMNSPGHRANILNPAYGRLGIGIIQGGIYGLMISQEFRN
jgi:uncharacterized protein YkwD